MASIVLCFTRYARRATRTRVMGRPLSTFDQVGAKRAVRGGHTQKYQMDERGRRLLLGTYDGTSEQIDMLMRELHVPRWCITRWAGQLGLARQKEPQWTPDELRYLEKHLTHVSVKDIADHLGRTRVAVRLKATRLGINKVFLEGYTARGVALGLGCESHKVQRWIEQGWLHAVRRNTEHPTSDPYSISDRDIRAFVKAHPNEIDLRRVEQLWFLDIIFCDGNEQKGLGPL